MFRSLSIALFILVHCVASASYARAQSTSTEHWTVVGFTGEPTPIGGVWTGQQAFQNPSITGQGKVDFLGVIAGGPGAIFHGEPGSLVAIVLSTDIMPGWGNPFSSLTSAHPISDLSGTVAFANQYAIWIGDGGDVVGLVEDNDPYPGAPAGGMADFADSSFGFAGHPRLCDDGSFGMRIVVDVTPPFANFSALVVGNLATPALTPVFQEDALIATAPPGMDWHVEDVVGAFRLASGQQVALRLLIGGAGVSPSNDATIWAGPAASPKLVAREGDPIPNSDPIAPLRLYGSLDPDVRINNAGEVAFRTTTHAGPPGTIAIVAGPFAAVDLVVQSGEIAPGAPPNTTFAFSTGSFSAPLIDSVGRLAFIASVTDPAPPGLHDEVGVWIGPPEDLRLTLYAGGQAPSLPPGVLIRRPVAPYVLTMNSFHQLAVLMELIGAGIDDSNDRALYVTSPTVVPLLVAREGDVVSISGANRTISQIIPFDYGGPEEGAPRTLSDTGKLLFVLRFTDGTEGLFIFDSLAASPSPEYLRGDCNSDGVLDVADPIFALAFLIQFGAAPECSPACDSNGDSVVNIADAITSFLRLFANGPPLPAPYPECGADPDAPPGCYFSACSDSP